MQTTRGLVAIGLTKLTTSMEDRHDNFWRGLTRGVHPHGHPPTMVLNRNRIVGLNGHVNFVTIAGKSFIHRVIDDFVN